MRPNDADGDQLVRACRGESEAVAELLARHRRGLYRFVYRLLGRHADTEDVVQETFVRAFRSLQRREVVGPFESWLFTIAARRCATWRVRERRQGERLEEETAAALVDDARSPHEQVVAREVQRDVSAALAKLPPAQRVAVALFELEGWRVAEIARALNCAPATVKVHLHRARLRLRRELTPYLRQEGPHEMPTCQTAPSGPAE